MADIGEVHHVAVTEMVVGSVNAGQRLEQVVLSDHPPEVEFFQPLGIKAGEQHVVDEQKVNLARFKLLYPLFAFLLAADIMQNQGGAFDFPCFFGVDLVNGSGFCGL